MYISTSSTLYSISIHALREEGDPNMSGASRFSSLFQSTPSARRATQAIMQGVYNHIISIHALREEGDRSTGARWQSIPYFNPRPPRGGRRSSSIVTM